MTAKKGMAGLKSAVRREAYKRTRNQVDAQILAEIWAWTPYAKTRRDGKAWVVKTDYDLIDDDGVAAAPRTVRASLQRLREQGLIETTRGPHPNGRLANSRYIRLLDGLFDELLECTENGRRRRSARRHDDAEDAHSRRNDLPAQHGGSSRFHKQGTNNEQHNRTNRKEQRACSGNNDEKRYRKGRREEISEELLEVQRRFSEGCRERGASAPALDDARRVAAVRRFTAACAGAGLSMSDAAEAAYLFALHYSHDQLAEHLGRTPEKVSPSPNHFVLGMAADIAVSLFRKEPNAFLSKWDYIEWKTSL